MDHETRETSITLPMSSTTATSQVHNTKPQPLNNFTAINCRRRSSAQSTTSSVSTLALPSPSIVAARAYFLEQLSPIIPFNDTIQRRKGLIEGPQFPRRHSALAAPGSLATQLENFSFETGTKGLTSVAEARKVAPGIKVEDENESFMVGARDFEDGPPKQSVSPRKSIILSNDPAEILRQVPFEYTHSRLRDWGYAYLGNTATADAFVNAVSLRQPNMALIKADGNDCHSKTQGLVTIRARVLPKTKERKPFLIQRQFDIEELRGTIPAARNFDKKSATQKTSRVRRSSRSRRPLTQHESTRRSSFEHQHGQISPSLCHGAVPIHIEYALHYLPVLAALMLSGHIRKGDSIDLPIPHPEAWRSVIFYIYTGKVTMTSAIQVNILYLAGNIA